MEAWRRVEVAACEEMDGPDGGRPRGDPRGDVHGRGGRSEREEITDHDVAAFVDVLSESAGPPAAGSTTASRAPTSSTPRSASSSRRAGRGHRPRRPRRWPRRSPTGRASTSTRVVHRPHARRPRRAHDVRHQARRASPWRRTATRERLERAFAQVAVGAISGAVGHVRLAPRPEFEARGPRPARARSPSPSPPRSSPRDRHAELLQAIALAGAGLERLATEIRHLQRTEVLEASEPFRAGAQKGSSAMPHKRNPITTRAHHRAGAGAARQRVRRRSRTSRCGTSATSRTPAPSA